jgi:transposase
MTSRAAGESRARSGPAHKETLVLAGVCVNRIGKRQTLRDWVHRYNAEGVAGLKSIRAGGHPASLNEEQMAELKALTVKGPDPAKDKVVRWRCVDLREEVARRFTVTVSERTIGRWLRRLEMTRLQPRPFHPKKDAVAQEDFKKNSAA